MIENQYHIKIDDIKSSVWKMLFSFDDFEKLKKNEYFNERCKEACESFAREIYELLAREAYEEECEGEQPDFADKWADVEDDDDDYYEC